MSVPGSIPPESPSPTGRPGESSPPELVAPAGTPAKLKTALHFGADAVYLGLKQYSMRSFAGNFDFDELEWALGYAHERGRKVYVAVNLQAFDDDFDGLRSSLCRLASLHRSGPGVDALIVADPGVLSLAREVAPDLPLHFSTQGSVTNASAARFWGSQGIQRVVVARELSLERLTRLVAGANLPIEVFAHGAVCVAYSGRCLLSLYWAGEARDTRRGQCAQGCRWPYQEHLGQPEHREAAIEDRRRPGLGNLVQEDERGTHFFDAKDLCTLSILDRLIAAGPRALKLEGRTRSSYYLALVVDVYRSAIDRIARGDLAGFQAAIPGYLDELRRSSNRPFSTHFLTGDENKLESYIPAGTYPDGRFEYVGDLLANDGAALRVRVKNTIRRGAVIELCDRGLRRETLDTSRLLDESGRELEEAKPNTTLVLPVASDALPNAVLREPLSS